MWQRGVCMAKGACMTKGDMCGERGICVAKEACTGCDEIWSRASGTHSTGMHSCLHFGSKGGTRNAHRPGVQIISFLCIFQEQICKILH